MNNAIEPEGNDEPEIDPSEVIEASEERNTPSVAPEVPANLESVVEWDTPVTSTGSAAPKVPMEDEGNIPQQLTLEGVDEADREQRIAASEPD